MFRVFAVVIIDGKYKFAYRLAFEDHKAIIGSQKTGSGLPTLT